MWTVIASPDEWAAYTAKMALELRLAPSTVEWGSPPAAYPCLVSSHMPPRPAGTNPRVYSAFVHLADAEALFRAAGRRTVDPDAPPPGPTQDQFNRWTAAQLLAVVKFLVDTGICKKEQFEAAMVESLEIVDEARNGRVPPGLSSTQLATLGSFNRPT